MSKLPSCRWLLVVAAIGLPGCAKPADSDSSNALTATTQQRLSAPTHQEEIPLFPPGRASRPHTEQDRLALFDELLAATLRRHAFSTKKNAALHLDFERDAAPLRDAFRTAQGDVELFRAIARLSALRRDAHMI